MQTLILVFLTVFVASASAETKTLRFEIKTKGQWGQHFSKIHQQGKKWWCETDLIPYFDSAVVPITSEDLLKLKNEMKTSQCQDLFVIHDFSQPATKTFSGCSTDATPKMILDKVSKACGRSI